MFEYIEGPHMDRIGPFIPIDFVTYVQYKTIQDIGKPYSVDSLTFPISHAMMISPFASKSSLA